MATMSKEDLLEVFKNMTVLELNEFLKAFEEEFGVTAAAPVAVAAAGGGGVVVHFDDAVDADMGQVQSGIVGRGGVEDAAFLDDGAVIGRHRPAQGRGVDGYGG